MSKLVFYYFLYCILEAQYAKIARDPDPPCWQYTRPALRELWAPPSLHQLCQLYVSPTAKSCSQARGWDQKVLQHLQVTGCSILPC